MCTNEDGSSNEFVSTLGMEPEEEGPGQFRILEALSATGLRSIRYAKEIKCPGDQGSRLEITANDLSKRAYESIKRNVELNGVDLRSGPTNSIFSSFFVIKITDLPGWANQ